MSKPLFQKRHYEAIAQIFKEGWGVETRKLIAEDFVTLFRRDNPKFNEDKFWRAINGKT